jgi:hypothetical protein
MQRLQHLLHQVSSWSRAMQWAFWASVFTLVFLFWDSTIAVLGDELSAQVVKKEQQIKELNQPTSLSSSLRNAVTSFGAVELPRKKADGASALTNAVHQILGDHVVEDVEYTRTKTNRINSTILAGIKSPGEQIEKIIGDIRFIATQEEVLHVISELESSPWIDAVTNIRLTKKGSRKILVDLSVEAWVVSKSARGGIR